MFFQKWQVFWNVLKVSEMAEQQETFDFWNNTTVFKLLCYTS